MWYKKAADRVGKRGRGEERRKEIEVKEGKREREREESFGWARLVDRQTHTHRLDRVCRLSYSYSGNIISFRIISLSQQMVKLPGNGNVQAAILLLAGWSLLKKIRRGMSRESREKRSLKRETSFVMAELVSPDFLKEVEKCSGSKQQEDNYNSPLASACRVLSARRNEKDSKLHQLLKRLKEGVEEDGGFPICAIVNGDLDRSLLRFLIAAEFDVDLARERISSMKKWREENDIDHMLRWILPDEKLAALKRCMPSSYHGFDKEGHPIHFEQTGRFRWGILKHCSAEELVKIHILAQEYQSRVLFPRASAMKGYTVDKMANILDLKGLNIGVLSNLHALNIFKEVQRIDQLYYPEMLSTTYIVNAGFVFRAVWNVLKVVFPAKDHKKLKMVPRGEKGLKMLREFIPEEHIPESIGGNPGSEARNGQAKMLEDLKEIRSLFSHSGDKSDKYIQKSIRIWSIDPERKLKLEYSESETVLTDLCKKINV